MWQTNDKSKLRRNDSKTIIPLHQAALYIMDCWWLLWHWPREVWWHTREAVHWRVPSLPELAGLQGSFSNNFPWICLDSEPFQSYSIIIESTPTNAFRLCSSCVPHAPLPPLPQEFRTMTMSLPHCWHCWHCWPPCPGVATESIKPLPAAAKRHSTLARATQATRMPGCHVPSKVLHTVCQDDPSWPPCDHVTRITHIYIIYHESYDPHIHLRIRGQNELWLQVLGNMFKDFEANAPVVSWKMISGACVQAATKMHLSASIKLARQSTKIGARMQSCQCIAFIVVS